MIQRLMQTVAIAVAVMRTAIAITMTTLSKESRIGRLTPRNNYLRH
jgi:hypothetical protein